MIHADTYRDWSTLLYQSEHAPKHVPLARCSSLGTRGIHTRSWAGTDSFGEAMELAVQGWDDGALLAEPYTSALFAQIHGLIERPEIVLDYTGEGFDIARLTSGEPEHWLRWENVLTPGLNPRVLRVLVDSFVSAGIEQETIRARGSVLLALVELAEFAGYRVELSLVLSSSSHSHTGDRLQLYAPIKQADQPAHPPRLAFALAHPAMFRRIWFGVVESLEPELGSRFGAGDYYCTPGTADSEGYDLSIPRMGLYDSHWQNAETARRWILDRLQEFGITLTEGTHAYSQINR